MMMSKVILLMVMNVIVMMVYGILLISPPEVELLTEDEQLFHSFHCASRVVALLARRKFKTFTSTFTPGLLLLLLLLLSLLDRRKFKTLISVTGYYNENY